MVSTSGLRGVLSGVVTYAMGRLVMPTFTILMATGCGGRETGDSVETTAQTAQALTEQRRVTFAVPAGVEFAQVALGANGILKIDDRAQVLATSAAALTTNAGLGSTAVSDYGTDSRVGPVTSTAAVVLRDRSQVTGPVTSGRTVTTGNNVVVTGATTQNAALTPVQEFSWNVAFELSTQDVTVLGAPQTLAPGARRNVHVFTGRTLTLNGSGVYHFEQLTLEPGSQLKLVAATGPVIVYVRSSLIFRGAMTGASADNVLFAYLGTVSPAIETSFNGTIVSPSASVRLATGNSVHSGSVLAKGVELDPGAQFTFQPFAKWDQIRFNVIPTLSCVERRTSDQKFAAVLGYYNPNPKPISAAVGPDNRFTPGAQNHGQPTTFLPGRFPAEFSIDFGATTTLTWTLQGTALQVPRTATACQNNLTASGIADTTVVAANPQANFGASSRLVLGPSSHVLVAFDRTGIKKQIGTGRYVRKATLEFQLATGAKPAAEVFVLPPSWNEGRATWNCADDLLPTGEAEDCTVGSEWSMTRDADREFSEIPPWQKRDGSRRIVGAWSATTLSFDVTRDVWDLLGGPGAQSGVSFVTTAVLGATGSAELFSREGGNPPVLRLELTTGPEVDPGGTVPLSFAVDPTIPIVRDEPAAWPDTTRRAVAGIRDGKGRLTGFVDQELLVRAASASELSAIAGRWNGRVMGQLAPPPGRSDIGILGVVRVNPGGADLAALLPRVLQLDHRLRGAHAFSSTSALSTYAIAVEERMIGSQVRLDWVGVPDAPTLQDWEARNIQDGPFLPPDCTNPATPGCTPLLGQNAFAWPGYAACLLTPPPVPGDPFTCEPTVPESSFVNQRIEVADAWRALALVGRLQPSSVTAAMVDKGGWIPTHPDYPPTTIIEGFGPLLPAPDHGHRTALAGYAVPGNAFGGAGPGGPVAHLELHGIQAFSTWELGNALTNIFTLGNAQVVSVSGRAVVGALDTVLSPTASGIETLVTRKIPFFGSAGNSNLDVDEESCFIECWEDESHEPCENSGVQCVGGLGYNANGKHPDSNFGSKGSIDFAGPWHPMRAIWQNPADNRFEVSDGATSAATPFVAGIAALLFAAGPEVAQANLLPGVAANVELPGDPLGTRVLQCLHAGSVGIGFRNGNTHVPGALKSIRCMRGGAIDADLPPGIMILDPPDPSTAFVGQLVQVRAVAGDYEDGSLFISWSSNIDGGLGGTNSEQFGTVVFRTPGTHILTASATAQTGGTVQTVSDSVVVEVAPAPFDIHIVTPPADGQTFAAGVGVKLAATGTGFGIVQPDPATITWSAVRDSDGAFDFVGVPGLNVTRSFTTLGATTESHTVTVTRTDPVTLETVSAQRQLFVLPGGPVLEILSPPLDPFTNVANISYTANATLEASANFPVTGFSWAVFLGNAQYNAGTGNPSTWRPDSVLNFSCSNRLAILQVTATSTLGTFTDNQQIMILPSGPKVGQLCVK